MSDKLDKYDKCAGQELALQLAVPLRGDAIERLIEALDRNTAAVEQAAEQARHSAKHGKTSRRPVEGSGRRPAAARNIVRVGLLEGPKSWKEVAEYGARFGHAERTMRDQRDHVAELIRVDGRWLWRLRKEESDGGQADSHM